MTWPVVEERVLKYAPGMRNLRRHQGRIRLGSQTLMMPVGIIRIDDDIRLSRLPKCCASRS